MTNPADHDRSADEGLDRVDRGQRVIAETQFGDCHDGKERAHFARPMRGELPADTHGRQEPAVRVTVEDVVEVAETASSWEAIEADDED